MKTRTGFVSNSSSSSFILQDAGFFKHFGITANDIRNAIVELCGGKNAREKQLADKIKECDEKLSRPDIISDDWAYDYYTKRKASLLKNGLDDWVVYDMKDMKERKECYKKWDDHFSWWIAPNAGNVEKWNEFERTMTYECGFDNIMDVINGKAVKLEKCTYDRKTRKHVKSAFTGGAALINDVKKSLGVKTMKEVLHDKSTTLMIHFADNEVMSIEGMSDHGLGDDKYSIYSQGENGTKKKKNRAKWESESYSRNRFFEILIKHFIKAGKVDLSDPELLSYWLVPEDHWWKTDKDSKMKRKKYFTESDKCATWKEVANDMLRDNTIMHEG